MIDSSLLKQYMKVNSQIQKYEFDFNFWNDLFLNTDCSQHHDSCNCAWDHFQRAEQARAMLKFLENEKLKLQNQYDLKKKSSNLIYAITIGSSQKTDVNPCLNLWHRFSNSADGKRTLYKEAYFEKGENGYIHIHAYIEKESKFSMSIPKLRKRYGTYKGKQHNFDIKRLIGVDAIKWKNYIKKDSSKPWNSQVNSLISQTTQEL